MAQTSSARQNATAALDDIVELLSEMIPMLLDDVESLCDTLAAAVGDSNGAFSALQLVHRLIKVGLLPQAKAGVALKVQQLARGHMAVSPAQAQASAVPVNAPAASPRDVVVASALSCSPPANGGDLSNPDHSDRQRKPQRGGLREQMRRAKKAQQQTPTSSFMPTQPLPPPTLPPLPPPVQPQHALPPVQPGGAFAFAAGSQVAVQTAPTAPAPAEVEPVSQSWNELDAELQDVRERLAAEDGEIEHALDTSRGRARAAWPTATAAPFDNSTSSTGWAGLSSEGGQANSKPSPRLPPEVLSCWCDVACA